MPKKQQQPRIPRKKPKQRTGGKSTASRHERLTSDLDLQARDLELYRTALTHRSFTRQRGPGGDQASNDSYERLEFLGDAVLGTIVTDALYRAYPDEPEGVLTRRRSGVVRTEQLAAWASELDLLDYLYLAPGERASESGRDRILAGAYEALIGAIYLDRGINAVRKFVNKQLKRDLNQIVEVAATSNPKGLLQEMTQDLHRRTPSYRTVETAGPPHDRTFTVEVRFRGRTIASGSGSTKRAAEEAAAKSALEIIENEGPGVLTSPE